MAFRCIIHVYKKWGLFIYLHMYHAYKIDYVRKSVHNCVKKLSLYISIRNSSLLLKRINYTLAHDVFVYFKISIDTSQIVSSHLKFIRLSHFMLEVFSEWLDYIDLHIYRRKYPWTSINIEWNDLLLAYFVCPINHKQFVHCTLEDFSIKIIINC